MLVWGLTGNIACGKSVVEALLRDEGVAVLDADQVARAVVEPGEPALEQVRAAFGAAVIAADGRLDRPALAAIVFGDASRRAQLEGILHPAIHERIAHCLSRWAEQGTAFAVVSAALMVETGSYRQWAGLAVVTCDEAVQLQRLRARDGFDEAQALARIRAQRPQAEKAALAQVVLHNDGSVEDLRAQVRAWLRGLPAPVVP